MAKRTADGKFLRQCSNRLHVDVSGPVVPNVENFVSVADIDVRVRSEWAKENSDKDR